MISAPKPGCCTLCHLTASRKVDRCIHDRELLHNCIDFNAAHCGVELLRSGVCPCCHKHRGQLPAFVPCRQVIGTQRAHLHGRCMRSASCMPCMSRMTSTHHGRMHSANMYLDRRSMLPWCRGPLKSCLQSAECRSLNQCHLGNFARMALAAVQAGYQLQGLLHAGVTAYHTLP